MNIKSAVAQLFLCLIAGHAVAAIDPVYEGANGIREKVFASNCLGCHSSALTGSARNGAPPSVNWDTYEATLPNAARAIVRAVKMMTMPPSFSGLPKLNEEQQTAMLAWQSAGFPLTATVKPTDSFSILSCVFNWLEQNYPQYYAPANNRNLTYNGNTYRYYSSTDTLIVYNPIYDRFYSGYNYNRYYYYLDIGTLSAWKAYLSCH